MTVYAFVCLCSCICVGVYDCMFLFFFKFIYFEREGETVCAYECGKDREREREKGAVVLRACLWFWGPRFWLAPEPSLWNLWNPSDHRTCHHGCVNFLFDNILLTLSDRTCQDIRGGG